MHASEGDLVDNVTLTSSRPPRAHNHSTAD